MPNNLTSEAGRFWCSRSVEVSVNAHDPPQTWSGLDHMAISDSDLVESVTWDTSSFISTCE